MVAVTPANSADTAGRIPGASLVGRDPSCYTSEYGEEGARKSQKLVL